MIPPPADRPSVLFVDDEQNVLRAIRRTLRHRADDLDLRFVNGAHAALEELERAPVDIISCDVAMPRMDGIELLQLVRKRWPSAVRLMLSASIGGDTMMRAIPVAHRFLAKPFDVESLEGALNRALSLRSMMSSPGLQSAVGGIRELPTLPATFQALAQVVERDVATFDDAVDVVREAPAIAARIMQIANSAFFGARGPVADLETAVRRIGLGRLKDLVLMLEVVESFEGKPAPAGFSLDDHQSRSVQVAQMAASLARDHSKEAYTAGLLYDVGSLVLALEMPDEWSEIRERADAEGRCVLELEREYLGADHAAIGGYLLGLWGLPQEVVEAVAFHREPSLIGDVDNPVLASVHLARAMSDQSSDNENEIDEGYLARRMVDYRGAEALANRH